MTKNSFGWNSLVNGLLNAPSLVAEVVHKNWFSRKKNSGPNWPSGLFWHQRPRKVPNRFFPNIHQIEAFIAIIKIITCLRCPHLNLTALAARGGTCIHMIFHPKEFLHRESKWDTYQNCLSEVVFQFLGYKTFSRIFRLVICRTFC